jgi:ankyrin repeat protein
VREEIAAMTETGGFHRRQAGAQSIWSALLSVVLLVLVPACTDAETRIYRNMVEDKGYEFSERSFLRSGLFRADILDLYIKGGIDVNARDEQGNTALILVALYGGDRREEADMLLAAGADADAQNDKGQTALKIAILTDQVGFVRLLIDNGADVNLKREGDDSPLGLATFMSAGGQTSPEIVAMLRDAGAVD